MSKFYTLRVSRSDITVPGKSKVPELYVKISYGDESCRTSSVSRLPPEWNETFPIACTCSDIENRFTIKLMKESLIDTSIGSVECSLEEILREDGEDVRIPLQSKSGSYAMFLSLQPSDKMKNAEMTLINLAHALLDIHPSSHGNFVENVNAIFDTAKCVAESKACRSLVEVGYTITAFVEFGDGIANASPYLKLVWCITTAFIKIIAEQPRTDKRVKDLVKNLMNLFLIIKETSIFANPSGSLLSILTELFDFITQCSTLLKDYARRNFVVRALLQNKKVAIEDLEGTLTSLKTDMISAFERQGIIEAQIRALKMELEKKLQPKHESGRDRQRCLEGTRIELLKEVEEWVQYTNVPNVFFILGRAGTGKSTIATTTAEVFQRKGQLGSHLYFMRDKSDPEFILRTIAFDLANRGQATAEAIKAQLDANDITSVTPERAFEILLFDPLHAITEEGKKEDNILIVLDALDECGNRETRKPYVRLIKEKLQTLPPNYRFLITSRPEEDIVSESELEQLMTRHIHLDHESNNAKGDVLKYIQTKLGDLKAKGRIIVDPSWPWDESMEALGDAAGGLFIWAATAVRLIESKKQNKAGELKRLVNHKSLSLDHLYATALENSLDWDDGTRRDFPRVFSLVLFGKEQLTTAYIDTMMDLDDGTTQSNLECLRSLVAFGPNEPVRLYHTSLYDYLISEGARGKAWFIDERKEKTRISLRCFELMEGLRFNICGLQTSYKLNKDVDNLEDRVKENISTSLLYACRHWASHLREVPYSENLCNQLASFALNRLLYWVEVLSLTGSLHSFLLQSLENTINWIGDKHSQLSAFLQDAHDQLLTFIEPISQSTPHLYMSFLPLLREDSIVAEHYAKRAQSLARVEYVGNKPQMACTRRIYADRDVFSISYSPDGERIASATEAGVIVWDAISGRTLLNPLERFTNCAPGVVYSADGKYIASGSENKTVNIWNASTGERVLGPLTGHSKAVNSVAFSGDGKFIASGSYDKTIRLWSAESGAPVGLPLKGHSKAVSCVVFSPNERYLASGSMDKTIIVWDVQSRKVISGPLKGRPGQVFSLSFSPDSERVASGSRDGTIRVWEVTTGSVLHTLRGDGMRCVFSIEYSDDGKHILSGSRDGIVRLWNAEASDAPPKRFEGHTQEVFSVSFAPDGKHFASASSDGTIRVWNVAKGVTLTGSKLNGQKSAAISAFAISPKTGKFLVSGHDDHTVCVWNTESGDLIKGPLEGHSEWVMSVAFSFNEIHFASASIDGTVQIWNMVDDKYITCDGHNHYVPSLAFSPDDKHLASGSLDKSIRVWSVESGLLAAEPLIGHTSGVNSIHYSPDGKKIASGSGDTTVRIWNASKGDLLSTFEGHSHVVNSVAYSHDGLYVVSGSDDNTIRVWNAETGQAEYGPLTGHVDRVKSVCFSPDGRWIISGSTDNTICVWNASTGNLFFQASKASIIRSIATFPTSDSNYIRFASSSSGATIHVWSVDVESEERKWCLEDDGWLTGSNGNLHMWIPPDLHKSIVHGPCIRTLNVRFLTRLHLSINQGEQWSACFPSSDAPVS